MSMDLSFLKIHRNSACEIFIIKKGGLAIRMVMNTNERAAPSVLRPKDRVIGLIHARLFDQSVPLFCILQERA